MDTDYRNRSGGRRGGGGGGFKRASGPDPDGESCGMGDLIQKLSRPVADEKQSGTRAG